MTWVRMRLGEINNGKKSLMNQQHYYRSSVLPSLSALCGRASLCYISVIHPVDTIHQSTPSPPLSIFAAPFSLNSVYHMHKNAFTFTFCIVNSCFRSCHPLQYTAAPKQDDCVVKVFLDFFGFFCLFVHHPIEA